MSKTDRTDKAADKQVATSTRSGSAAEKTENAAREAVNTNGHAVHEATENGSDVTREMAEKGREMAEESHEAASDFVEKGHELARDAVEHPRKNPARPPRTAARQSCGLSSWSPFQSQDTSYWSCPRTWCS